MKFNQASFAAGERRVADFLVESGLVESKGEAKRLIKQGGVKIDGSKVENAALEIDVRAGSEMVIQVGKRKFLKVTGS